MRDDATDIVANRPVGSSPAPFDTRMNRMKKGG